MLSQQHLSNKQTVFDLAETNILSCSISNKIIRCIVECPRCNAKITCVKQSTWRFWNLIKHIAKHSNQAERRAEIVEFSETGAAISSVVHRINNEDDLNRILRWIFLLFFLYLFHLKTQENKSHFPYLKNHSIPHLTYESAAYRLALGLADCESA